MLPNPAPPPVTVLVPNLVRLFASWLYPMKDLDGDAPAMPTSRTARRN